MVRVPFLRAAVGVLMLLPVALPAQRKVPAPKDVIGFEPGTDRKLPPWKDVVSYFQALDAASPRISVRTLGKTTLGRPFIAAFIGDSATLANLPRYREIQRKLADPRVQSPNERQRLIDDGKVVVLVTSSIHSTEVGGILTPMTLAHKLVTQEDAESREIRRNVLTIMVPSLNPDGVDIVGDWYRSSLGTAWEGTGPPVLYHHYTGHDNNRDWYSFTQNETKMTVDSLHNVWHPQITNDIHQQGSGGSRIFIPPYMDPIEPNIDPVIMAGVAQMGKGMTWRMTAEGKTGIANNTSYDAWTPARAYMHYHGGIRILTETASAQIASPITVSFDSLRPGYNVDPKVAGVDYLSLWTGGRWGIGDIVAYQTSASWALLAEASGDRATWLRSFAMVGDRAVAGRSAPGRSEWPVAYVIPAAQRDTAALQTALRILQRGQVEVRRLTSNGRVAGVWSPAIDSRRAQATPAAVSQGDYVIFTGQPYGAFAKTMLERQRYPNLYEYPGGPPKRPYDVTAHTLPLLMGFNALAAFDSAGISASAPIAPLGEPRLLAPGLSGNSARRIALYRSYSPSMDEGWTRFIFDSYKIRYTSVADRDVRSGTLNARFDVIILPEQAAAQLARGARGNYPDSLRGGLGDEGAASLKSFVENGGTLIAFNDASDYAISALSLPVKDALDGVNPREFYAPGSQFRVNLDTRSLLAGRDTSAVIWFESSPAFEITDPSRATAVAVYPSSGNPMMSGWLLGAPRLAGKAAMVDVKLGKGHVILFGFRPQYRAQTMATYPLLWRAMLGSESLTP
jgi:hypothetical protein